MPVLTHLVSLRGPAGVELQFAEFVRRAVERHAEWKHGWLDPSGSMHPLVAEHIGDALTHTARTKHAFGVRLPARPMGLRAWHSRRVLRRSSSDITLIWNRSARAAFVLQGAGPKRCIHCEHGAAWFSGREAERRDYFRQVPVAICNSRAASRLLEDVWGFAGRLDVVPNALRPSLARGSSPPRSLPRDRPFRVGAAARLFPVKGLPLVLHTLRELRDRGRDVELRVAGAGPERARLEGLAEELGIGPAVDFLGAVADMSEFYSTIDCLVHTPVTEAFGLVAIEAGAHACPAIVAAVDGLPEAVAHETSGLCLRPTLPLAGYADLGGSTAGMPNVVFDPFTDSVATPHVVAPSDLADAVESLLTSPGRYERLSRMAAQHVAERFGFDSYVDAVINAVGSALDRAG